MARLLRGGVAAALMSLVVLLLPTSTAHAANPNIRYTTSVFDAALYEVRASHSWQCLDVQGGNINPGAVVGRWDCKGNLHQRFYFMPSGTDGLFHIGVYGRYCLGRDLQGGSADVVLDHCQGPGQHFRWVDRGNDHWEIVETTTNKCIHDAGRGNPVQLRDCGDITDPYPSLWSPRYTGQYNYGSFNG